MRRRNTKSFLHRAGKKQENEVLMVPVIYESSSRIRVALRLRQGREAERSNRCSSNGPLGLTELHSAEQPIHRSGVIYNQLQTAPHYILPTLNSFYLGPWGLCTAREKIKQGTKTPFALFMQKEKKENSRVIVARTRNIPFGGPRGRAPGLQQKVHRRKSAVRRVHPCPLVKKKSCAI